MKERRRERRMNQVQHVTVKYSAYDILYKIMYCLLQYKQVQAFIPETFHKIKISHDTPEGKVDFNWKRCCV